ncbi:MAG: hypothetical protein QM813_06190 [Verrucomicrobiota bacterium]
MMTIIRPSAGSFSKKTEQSIRSPGAELQRRVAGDLEPPGGLQRLAAGHRREGRPVAAQVVGVGRGVAQVAFEEPVRHARGRGGGVLDAQLVQRPLEEPDLQRLVRRRGNPLPRDGGAMAIDLDPDLVAIPPGREALPLAEPGLLLRAHARLHPPALRKKEKLDPSDGGSSRSWNARSLITIGW